MIKLVLDRSIFHGDLFQIISQKLKELQEKGIISVYISPMLIEETLPLIFNSERRGELKRHLQFILEISKNRWLEDCFEIFRSELGIMPLREDYQFCKLRAEKIIKENIGILIAGGEPEPTIYKQTRVNKNNVFCKMQNMKKIGHDMRLEVSRILSENRKKRNDIKETWGDFRDHNIYKFGEELIKRKQFHTKFFCWVAIKRWANNRERCPYFYDWIRGLLYIQFYAMKYPNNGIDNHAQADIQHLLYLKEVDGIVSEDKSFMRKAWEEIYAPNSKKYLTIKELNQM